MPNRPHQTTVAPPLGLLPTSTTTVFNLTVLPPAAQGRNDRILEPKKKTIVSAHVEAQCHPRPRRSARRREFCRRACRRWVLFCADFGSKGTCSVCSVACGAWPCSGQMKEGLEQSPGFGGMPWRRSRCGRRRDRTAARRRADCQPACWEAGRESWSTGPVWDNGECRDVHHMKTFCGRSTKSLHR